MIGGAYEVKHSFCFFKKKFKHICVLMQMIQLKDIGRCAGVVAKWCP